MRKNKQRLRLIFFFFFVSSQVSGRGGVARALPQLVPSLKVTCPMHGGTMVSESFFQLYLFNALFELFFELFRGFKTRYVNAYPWKIIWVN
jgi:hypothetical protein